VKFEKHHKIASKEPPVSQLGQSSKFLALVIREVLKKGLYKDAACKNEFRYLCICIYTNSVKDKDGFVCTSSHIGVQGKYGLPTTAGHRQVKDAAEQGEAQRPQ